MLGPMLILGALCWLGIWLLVRAFFLQEAKP